MTRSSIVFLLSALSIIMIALIVYAAISAAALGWLIAGVVVLCLFALGVSRIGVVLADRLIDAKNKRDAVRIAYHLKCLEKGYQPIGAHYELLPSQRQISAPVAQSKPESVDPRHALLVSLCLMTIRAEGYGPTSHRLLSANDAQDISSKRGGQFADRDKWDEASKYGQQIGWLYTQVGGKKDEQGLKIKIEGGGNTVTDLIDALMQRNLICDSAVSALPGVAR
jgi:hypothetical protein